MSLVPLELPPGVYRNGTEYQSRGRFFDSNLVRWYEGTLRPIGGWVEKSVSAVSGAARAMVTWRDNSNQVWAGVGTHSGLYAMTRSGSVNDVTPAGFSAGRADADTGGGYGYGAYGSEAYGAAREDSTVVNAASMWTLDVWGEYLVGCMADDGTLYEWRADTASVAQAIANAPTARASLVTGERIMMALGANGNPRLVKWCDQENNTDWTASATNQAGDFQIKTSGQLMCGVAIRGGALLFTDVDAHVAQYVGLPFVYSFNVVGDGCGIVSQGAAVAADSVVYWMGKDGFWTYNGYVSPLYCEVGDYVFSGLNEAQQSKVWSLHNSAYGEVWWFYPSAASDEIDRYVIYNYREQTWSIGALSRLCGADRSAFSYPLMVDASGDVQEHETGYLWGGASPFARSGPLEMQNGSRVITITGVIPDEDTAGDVELYFYGRFHPNDTEVTYGPYDPANPTDVRVTARQFGIEYRTDQATDWRVGSPRVEVELGGER